MIVTGGAGGIGSAITRQLAQAGATVVITYNSDSAKADALLATLPGNGHAVRQASVTDSASLEKLADFRCRNVRSARYTGEQCRHYHPRTTR